MLKIQIERVGTEDIGISLLYENGKKIFITSTILELLAELKEKDLFFQDVIDVLIDLKYSY